MVALGAPGRTLLAAALSFVASAGAARAAGPTAHWELVSRPLIQVPAQAVFDTVRKKVVVLSGEKGDASLWDWDGKQWTQWYPQFPRPDQGNAALAFDTVRGRLILVTAAPDVWELDPQKGSWRKVDAVGTRPGPRFNSQAIYDPDRQRLYLIGGSSAVNDPPDFQPEVWEWDPAAATWTHRLPASFNTEMPVVYDLDRKRLVEMDAHLSVLAECDPATGMWTYIPIPPAAGHDARLATALYDPATKAVIGIDANWGVWRWDPVGVKFVSVAAPGGRTPVLDLWRTATFDPVRQVHVMTGGWHDGATPTSDAIFFRDEVWEWSAAKSFVQATPAHDYPGALAQGSAVIPDGDTVLVSATNTSGLSEFGWSWKPSTRAWVRTEPMQVFPNIDLLTDRRFFGMVYDSSRKAAIVFGGDSGGAALSDIWDLLSFENVWVQRSSSSGPTPPPRSSPALAYDAKSGTMYLQGGLGATGNPLSDSWEWNGASGVWTHNLDRVAAPTASGALFLDTQRDVLVFVTTQDLAVWEAPAARGAWTKVGAPPASGPTNPQLSFDTLRRKIIAHGGADPISEDLLSDVWEWDVDARQWSHLPTVGEAPGPRWAHMFVYEPGRESFFVYGGGSFALASQSITQDAFRDGWELTIGDLPGGERCSVAHPERCASRSCVDGRCCPVGGPCAAAPDAAVPADAATDASATVDASSVDASNARDPDAGMSAVDAPVVSPDAAAPDDGASSAGRHALYDGPACAYAIAPRASGLAVAWSLLVLLVLGRRRLSRRPAGDRR